MAARPKLFFLSPMRDFTQDHRWLSINTATIRKSSGADLPLPGIIDACVRKGSTILSGSSSNAARFAPATTWWLP